MDLNKVYDVLVKHGGARESDRDQFISLYSSHNLSKWPFEFRFQGIFGFGGKLRRAWNDTTFSVDYYPEDKTALRQKRLHALNKALKKIS